MPKGSYKTKVCPKPSPDWSRRKEELQRERYPGGKNEPIHYLIYLSTGVKKTAVSHTTTLVEQLK